MRPRRPRADTGGSAQSPKRMSPAMSSAIEYSTNGSAFSEAGSGSRVLRARLVDDKAADQLSTSVPTAAEPAMVRTPPAAAPAQRDAPPQLTPRLVVPVVVGTRPEAIKLVPIILAMRASESLQPIVVSTGQHHRMVKEIFELAGITTDVTLWAGGRRELNERVSSVMRRFEDFVIEWFGILPENVDLEDVVSGRFPAAVLVHGDTSSAMAAALAAFHLRIPVMHVEAGLRTGGLNLTPFPEELNRQLISCMACAAPRPDRAQHAATSCARTCRSIRSSSPATPASTRSAGPRSSRCRFGNPALQAICDGDAAGRRGDRASPRELGRRPRRDRRGRGAAGPRAPRRAIRGSAAPQPARAPEAGRPAARPRRTCSSPSRWLRAVRTAAGALPPRDHRLRRHPGGGAGARQAGARHARADRAHRGHRGRDAAARRDRPRPDLRRGPPTARPTRSPTPR